MYTGQLVSTTHYSLKVTFLKWLLVLNSELNVHSKDKGGSKELLVARVQSAG